MEKIKKFIKWLFVTFYGRYLLGVILAITGVFSEYSTIDFLSTDYRIFEYTCIIGILIIVIQFFGTIAYILGRLVYSYYLDSMDAKNNKNGKMCDRAIYHYVKSISKEITKDDFPVTACGMQTKGNTLITDLKKLVNCPDCQKLMD